jgi:hypothetical protein
MKVPILKEYIKFQCEWDQRVMTAKKKVQKLWLKSILHKSRETFRPGDNILYNSAQCLWVFST